MYVYTCICVYICIYVCVYICVGESLVTSPAQGKSGHFRRAVIVHSDRSFLVYVHRCMHAYAWLFGGRFAFPDCTRIDGILDCNNAYRSEKAADHM